MTTNDLIGSIEAALLLGVSKPTVVRMAADGRLAYELKVPGKTGAYLFRRDHVEALAMAS